MPTPSPVINIAVIGSGVWGAAYGNAIAAPTCNIVFWDRVAAVAQAAAAQPHCRAAATLAEAVADADMIIVAVSSSAFALVLTQLTETRVPIIWLTKGFDAASGKPLYDIAAEILGADADYGVISGPSFAAEVSQRLPAALSLAMRHPASNERIRTLLHRPHLRHYPEDDIIGVCMGGAIKNIIAIAAGICDGLKMGENARAALIARGLAEMSTLTVALGGKRDTLLGLSGSGDLILTCCSDLSRNRQFGLRLAAGSATDSTTTTEGVAAARAAAAIARQLQLDLPIITTVAAVLAHDLSPVQAAQALLARPPR